MGSFRYAGRPAIVERIVRRVESGPFLFAGPAGAGKEATALEVARRVLCATGAARDDGCESCAKALTFQHPDIRWIGPAPANVDAATVRELFEAKIANPFHQPAFAATSQIAIGDPEDPGPLSLRALLQFLRRQAFQGRWRVAIVADAHRMNAAAANAFLKTLEEPPPRSLIILTAAGAAGLLPTILSRCQRVAFEPLPDDELTAILRGLAPEADDRTLADAVRLADGNARRGLMLLSPDAQAIRAWTADVFRALGEGRAAEALIAAEHLNAGHLPGGDEAGDPGRKRQRAILFCEMLAQLYGEAVACRERGDRWRPRAPELADLVRRTAATRSTTSLLDDVARLDAARGEVDGNLNLGLCAATLLQDLSDHARHDA